jgi:hypothetical protein
VEVSWFELKDDINECYAGTTKHLSRVLVGFCLIITNSGAKQTCICFKMLMKIVKESARSERDSLAMLLQDAAHSGSKSFNPTILST